MLDSCLLENADAARAALPGDYAPTIRLIFTWVYI